MAHVLPQECPTCGKDRDTCGGHPGHATVRLRADDSFHHFDFDEVRFGLKHWLFTDGYIGWLVSKTPRHRVFVDVETTGLNEDVHQVFEVAWALDVGPVHSFTVPHTLDQADDMALEINRYHRPGPHPLPVQPRTCGSRWSPSG